MSKVQPAFLKKSAPIAENALDRRARIELSAECVHNQTEVGREILQCGFRDLERVGALVNEDHGGSDLGAKLHVKLSN